MKVITFSFVLYAVQVAASSVQLQDAEIIKTTASAQTEQSDGVKLQEIPEGTICQSCREAVDNLLTFRRLGGSLDDIESFKSNLCPSLGLESYTCNELDMPTLVTIIDARSDLTSNEICGVIFQSESCKLSSNLYFEWSVNINETGRIAVNRSKHRILTASDNDLVIVHITDVHYDPLYREGANAVCDESVCCRVKPVFADVTGQKDYFLAYTDFQENGTSTIARAGRWGDYRRCDSPWETVLDLLQRVRANHEKIDYIYFTGDVVDHAVSETSVEGNAKSITKTFEAMRAVFGDIPIYPIIGNHESHPAHQFAPTQLNETDTKELYHLLADTWHWLPESARETIREVGYYTTLLRSGFRVVALNNNVGFILNSWLLYDSRYAATQLQWLHDTLLEAERKGEKVHILAHIPNEAGDMFSTYSREYRRIVDRFWDTITGQFNGHTHVDQFSLYYAIDQPDVAMNVAWNGGSGTAFNGVNSNYRVYSVDDKTLQVTDHVTWIYNLTEANANRDVAPVWFREYRFSDAYEIEDLSPSSLDCMLNSFATNHDLLRLYMQHKFKMSDTLMELGCDNECLLGHLCDITKQLSIPGAKNRRCEELTLLFWNNVR